MGGTGGAEWNLRSGEPREVMDYGTSELETSALPPHNKKVAGSGRLRRPSSQPAILQAEPGSQISVGSVAEPGNQVVWAGSATSER